MSVGRNQTYYRRHATQAAEYGKRYRAQNAHKRAAHSAVRAALLNGSLVRPNCCEDCGAACVPHGHHEDYQKPLEVRWMCVPCHRRAHGVRLRAKVVARGEKVGTSKLTEVQAREIKALLANGEPHWRIAQQFAVCRSNISLIARGKSWKHA